MSARRAAAVFILLTAVFTWPQVLHPLSVPGNIDAYFNMWRIGWIAHQLPIDPSALFDANIYYPQPRTLALSDAVLLQGIVGLPFVKLGVPLVLVTNGLIFAGFVLSGLGMFLLVRDLTGRAAPAVLAGMVFAFAPFRFDHYFHLEMGWAQWMPLTLWAVHRTIRTGRWAYGLGAGVFVALQGYSSVYYTVFLAAALVLTAPIFVWMAAPAIRRRAVLSLLAGGVVAAMLLAPYVRVYRQMAVETGGRSRQESLLAYAAGPKHYFAAMPTSLVYGKLTGDWGQHEKRLLPGLIVMVLAGFSLWPPIDRRRVIYALMLAFAVDISFAHRGLLLGWLYDHVFAFRGLRVPPRIGQLMLLAAGVLAAIGLSRLLDWLPAARPRWRTAAVALALGLTGVEYLTTPMTLVPVRTTPSSVTDWLRTQPHGVVAEFPAPGPASEAIPEVYYQYESTFHWFPLLNGYSGMYPTTYVEWVREMQDFPSDASIAALAARGAMYLIVHEHYYPRGEYERIVSALAARTDLVGFGPFAEPSGHRYGGEVRAYRLLKQGKQ
jgi:hypothetical protein